MNKKQACWEKNLHSSLLKCCWGRKADSDARQRPDVFLLFALVCPPGETTPPRLAA